MTFRFDRITFETAPRHPFCGCWTISFKGVCGKGVYGRLATTQDGLLLLHNMSDDRELIVPGFVIPVGADKQTVSRCIAQALLALDWGPEVDQRGNVVNSATYQWQVAWR
jgi:hypothetical protein